jgi:GMP synthase (glutamine-hydrolysing)
MSDAMMNTMKDILIIKNISREGPGILEDLLQTHNLTYDIVDLDAGDHLPAFNHKAMVVLGGPDSANDQTPKITAELSYVRERLQEHVPFMGICLGLQIGVKALGGTVIKSPVKEIGLLDPNDEQFTIELTPQGQTDPLLSGLPASLDVFHLHGETVDPTGTMELLGQGKYCHNQIIKLREKAYGIQSHFELTRDMLEVWTAQDPDLIPFGSQAIMSQFLSIEESYTVTGKTIFSNFLHVAGVI